MPRRSPPCPVCGFDASSVGPADAAAAARSFPRRFRALLVRPDDDDPEIVHRAPGPGAASAFDHAAAAAAGMAQAAEALARVQSREGTEVDAGTDPGDGATVAGAAGGRTLAEVLDAAAGAAGTLAAAVEAVHGDSWARTGVLAGGALVHALDLARAGVHAGSHHLRAAERVVARVRLLPR